MSTDYDGDATTANWTSIKSEINMPAGNSWTFVNSGDVSLNAYEGETINIAFKYLSSADNAATWEISEIKITEGDKILEGEPYELNDMYKYDNGMWMKLSDVLYLNPKDYDEMGAPGKYDSFSADALPKDYLPKYLDNVYPTAGEGVDAIVVYKYYTGIEGTVTIATQYSYANGAWKSAYDYIETATNQFVHNGIEWLFDPTITFTMTSAHYQTVVDYVRDTYGEEYINSYKTADFIYGADAYYGNFDLADWDQTKFDTWDEAIEEALSLGLLPSLYPNATVQVNGVDMFYQVIFQTYGDPAGNFMMRFSVSKEGPNPEFMLEEGPTAQ